MKNKISIIKIGGNIINDESMLDSFLADFTKIDDPKILIHGGGKIGEHNTISTKGCRTSPTPPRC